MNILRLLGIVFIIAIIIYIGINSGRKVKNAESFSTSDGSGSMLVVASISLATIIGGATTVGTSQTAFEYGFSGIWYGIGCFISYLLLVYITPKVRGKNNKTFISFIGDEFGKVTEIIVSFMICTAMIISIILQLISASSVIRTLFPFLSQIVAVCVCAFFIMMMVILGGSLSTSSTGKIKIILISLVLISSFILVNKEVSLIEMTSQLDKNQYFNPFSRSIGYELSNVIATAIGLSCTQENMLALLAGKSDKAVKKGLSLCAIMVMVLSICSISIGLYMKINYPEIASSAVFSTFLFNKFPPLLSGIAIGTLYISLILSSSGTVLGVSTIFVNNTIIPLMKKKPDNSKELFMLRSFIVIALLIGIVGGSGIFGDYILGFSLLSMTLRTVTMLVPLVFALYFKNRANKKIILWCVIISPIVTIAASLMEKTKDFALYIGLAINIIMAIISLKKDKTNIETLNNG